MAGPNTKRPMGTSGKSWSKLYFPKHTAAKKAGQRDIGPEEEAKLIKSKWGTARPVGAREEARLIKSGWKQPTGLDKVTHNWITARAIKSAQPKAPKVEGAPAVTTWWSPSSPQRVGTPSATSKGKAHPWPQTEMKTPTTEKAPSRAPELDVPMPKVTHGGNKPYLDAAMATAVVGGVLTPPIVGLYKGGKWAIGKAKGRMGSKLPAAGQSMAKTSPQRLASLTAQPSPSGGTGTPTPAPRVSGLPKASAGPQTVTLPGGSVVSLPKASAGAAKAQPTPPPAGLKTPAAPTSQAPKQGVTGGQKLSQPTQGTKAPQKPGPGTMSKPSKASPKPAEAPKETFNAPTQATSEGTGLPKPTERPAGLPEVKDVPANKTAEAQTKPSRTRSRTRGAKLPEGVTVPKPSGQASGGMPSAVKMPAAGGDFTNESLREAFRRAGFQGYGDPTPSKPAAPVSHGATPQPTGGMPKPTKGAAPGPSAPPAADATPTPPKSAAPPATGKGRADEALYTDFKGRPISRKGKGRGKTGGYVGGFGTPISEGEAEVRRAERGKGKGRKGAQLPEGITTPKPAETAPEMPKPTTGKAPETPAEAPPKTKTGETVIRGPDGSLAIRKRHTRPATPQPAAEAERMARSNVDEKNIVKPTSPGPVKEQKPGNVVPGKAADKRTKSYLENVEARRQLEAEMARGKGTTGTISSMLPEGVREGLAAIRGKAEQVARDLPTPEELKRQVFGEGRKPTKGQADFETQEEMAKSERAKTRARERAGVRVSPSQATPQPTSPERAQELAQIEKFMREKGYTRVATPTEENILKGEAPATERVGPEKPAKPRRSKRAAAGKGPGRFTLAAEELRSPGRISGGANRKGGRAGKGVKGGILAGALIGGLTAAERAQAAVPGQRAQAAGEALKETGVGLAKAAGIAGGLSLIPGVGPAAAAGYLGYEGVRGAASALPTIREAGRQAINLGSAMWQAYQNRKAMESRYGTVERATETRRKKKQGLL